MSDISLVALSVVTVVLESLLYGLLLVLFSTNLYLRITRFARPRQFGGLWWNAIVISSITIFAICTAHWIITVERFFLAFLGSARDPLRFYMDNSQPTSGVNNTLEIMAVLVGDAVIIHRLWIIWNRDLRVIFVPLISWLGGLICGIRVVCLFIQSTPSNEQFFIADGAWVTAYWALTAIPNISCTTFIACRIWKTSRATAEVGGDLLRPVFGILIESAAIWTAWAIFFAATYLTGSTLLFLVRDLTPSIIGLVNLLIYLRVGLGCSRADATGPPMTSSTSMFAVNITTVNEEYCLESVSETGPTSNQSAF